MSEPLAIWGLRPLLKNASQGFSLSCLEHESASRKRKVLHRAWLSSAKKAALAHGTERNETERNRTRTKRNVIERRCAQFPFGFWLNKTKPNGIVLNDNGNVFLTHTVVW